MYTQDHEWFLRHLTGHTDLHFSEVLFVENIASWCRQNGIDEADEDRPLRIVMQNGARLLVRKMVSDESLEARINAARIRGMLVSVRADRADLLDSPEKKLAYLFLKELSLGISEFAHDELAADAWIFEQLDRIGITNPSTMRVAEVSAYAAAMT